MQNTVLNDKNYSYGVVAILSIVITALILRIVMFSGYVSGDDAAYVTQAVLYANGDFAPPSVHWGVRSLPIFFTSISFRLFGVNPIATALFPMVFSIGSVVVAYFLANELFDRYTAILSAFLVAIFPMEVIFASHLFPYAFLSFFCSASLLTYLKAIKLNHSYLYLVAGLLLGLAYLSRITALFCLLFFFLHTISERNFSRKIAYFIFGLVSVVILESAFFYKISGDPFHRIDVLVSQVGPSDTAGQRASTDNPKPQRSINWTKKLLEPFYRPVVEQELGLFFVAIFLTSLIQLRYVKSYGPRVLLLWVIPIYFYTVYGTMSPFDYRPLRRLPRYMSPIIIPATVLVAWQIRSLSRRWLQNGIILALITSAILSMLVDASPSMTKREKELASFVSAHPNEQFLIPRTLYFDVAYYLGFRKNNNIDLFHERADGSHTLQRIKLTMPYEENHTPRSAKCGTYAVTQGKYLSIDDLPQHAEFVLELAKPETLKQRLLESPLMIEFLSLVRDKTRVRTLKNERDDAVRIYKVLCD